MRAFMLAGAPNVDTEVMEYFGYLRRDADRRTGRRDAAPTVRNTA